ncbi:hypothetical protein BH11MYX3_BH11MYX3_45880 [soil metagenome]
MKAVLAALLLPLLPTVAAAGPMVIDGPPGSQPAPTPAPARSEDPPVRAAVPAQPTPVKLLGMDLRQSAVASNRGLVSSTALTVPEGKVEVTLQAVVPFFGIASLNAGITKSTELWVAGATTINDESEGDSETAYGIGVKQVLVRGRNASVALTGSLRKFSGGFNSGNGWKSLGAVASLCSDDSCNLLVSGGVQQLFGFRDGDYGESKAVTMVTLNASVGSGNTRLLLDTVTIEGETVGFLGVRLGGRSGAFDLGFAKALGDHGEDSTIPWVGVTGRM